ncbi:MAG: hypothetical protein WKF77_06900 [Planctomycetaceae bacterium]
MPRAVEDGTLFNRVGNARVLESPGGTLLTRPAGHAVKQATANRVRYNTLRVGNPFKECVLYTADNERWLLEKVVSGGRCGFSSQRTESILFGRTDLN